MDALSASSRPASARGAPLSLAERVALYCYQSTAANNAAVLRSVAKPTAEEIAEFLQQSSAEGTVVYEDPALVRLLLTDRDYDAVCRETLNLQDAISWHAKHASHRKKVSTSSLDLLLLAPHVFTNDELRAALELAAARGMDDVLRLFPADPSVAATNPAIDVVTVSKGGDHRQLSDRSVIKKAVEDGPCVIHPETASTEMYVGSPLVLDDTQVQENNAVVLSTSDIEASTRRVDEHVLGDNTNLSQTEDPTALQIEPTVLASDRQPVAFELVGPHEEIADAIETSNNLADREATDCRLEDEETLARELSLVVYHELTAVRECVERAVEAAISTATDRSVQQIITVQVESERALEVGDARGTEALVHDEVPASVISASAATDTPLSDSTSGIESIVRTLDADLVDGEGADLDDVAFGEDALLLGGLTATIPEPGGILLPPNDPVESAIGELANLTIRTDGETPNPTTAFKVGDAIEARYRGTVHFFPGRIAAIHESDGTFDISYKDGDAESNVHSDLIRYPTGSSPRNLLSRAASSEQMSSGRIPHVPPEPVFRVGDAVEARFRGLSKYFPGEIAVVLEGSRYDVRYADGEYESDVRAELIRRLAVLDTGQAPLVRAATSGKETTVPATIATTEVFNEATTAKTTESQASVVHTTETDKAESHDPVLHAAPTTDFEPCVVSDPGDLPSRMESEQQRLNEVASIVEGSAVPSTTIMHEELNRSRDPKKRSHSTQRVETARDTNSRPTPVAKRLTEGQETIRPVLTFEVAQVGGNRQESTPNSVPTVTQSYLQRKDRKPSDEVGDPPDLQRLTPRSGSGSDNKIQLRGCKTPRNSVADLVGGLAHEAQTAAIETTPVEPFKDTREPRAPTQLAKDSSGESPAIVSARALLNDDADSDDDLPSNLPLDLSDDDIDEALAVEQILHATTQINKTTPRAEPAEASRSNSAAPSKQLDTGRKASSKRKPTQKGREQLEPEPSAPVLSASTLRYLSPQPRPMPMTARTQRSKTNSQQAATPRAATPSHRCRTSSRVDKEPAVISWKELEEWKNVDAILNRKRRVVHNGQMEGSDVPWGEEFAAIQSLKRFAVQHPDVLRDHIESQLAEVVNSATAVVGRPMTTKATSAARDALFLVKDLAFLLRHRLAPFLDSILPVVLPAVFHSQKRYLCDTAYEVLEALVTHCSSRRLVVALLRQALSFPRDDLRLVNLTCLYVEKCLATLSAAAVEELVARCASTVLDAVAELLTCKSAACQSSLQKSLMALQYAVGEEAMDQVLADHLAGNALALVRKHVALAEAAARGVAKSPSSSPKKQAQQHSATPAKHAAALAAAANTNGGVSILQRMLAQRRNRVVPAPE